MIGRILLYSLAAACCASIATGCVSKSMAATTDNGDASRKVELTVYKDDFAMVRENRPVSLDQGTNKLQISNISSKLDPSSVLFTWPTPGSADVFSNTYDLGMPSGRSLLKRYVEARGEPASLRGKTACRARKLTGTLEVATDNSIVLKSNGKYFVDPDGTVTAPDRPDIVAMSQLSVGVDSKSKQSTNLGIAYLTGGLGWSADYVAKLDPTGDTLSLECWATVTNHTGIAFPESKITLVAGSPNRAVTEHMAQDADMSLGSRMKERRGANPASESTVFLGGEDGRARAPMSAGELYAYPIDLPAILSPPKK